MYTAVLVIHVIVAVVLIGFILIQRGRSSGLIEALGGVESIFGTKTSNFFVKATVVLSITFFCTSISLAYLSKQRSISLFDITAPETADIFQEEPQRHPEMPEDEGDLSQDIEIPQNIEVDEEKTE